MPRSFLANRTIHTVDGLLWYLDPQQTIDRSIIQQGQWEGHSTRVVKQIMQPGMTALDVGANIGYYSLLLSRLVGPSGHVVAAEAMAEPIEILREHLRLNCVENVTVIEGAIGKTAGTARGLFTNYSWCAEPGEVSQHPTDCMLWTVDELWPAVAPTRPLHFIKIDTDGYDLDVLLGAEATINQHHPYILIEVCDYTLRAHAGLPPITEDHAEYGGMVRRLCSWLEDHGYQLFHEEDLSPVAGPAGAGAIARFNMCRSGTNLLAKHPLGPS